MVKIIILCFLLWFVLNLSLIVLRLIESKFEDILYVVIRTIRTESIDYNIALFQIFITVVCIMTIGTLVFVGLVNDDLMKSILLPYGVGLVLVVGYGIDEIVRNVRDGTMFKPSIRSLIDTIRNRVFLYTSCYSVYAIVCLIIYLV